MTGTRILALAFLVRCLCGLPDAALAQQEIEERGPSMLIGGHALVTEQIPRTTSFEKGSPNQVALRIHDDQAIVSNMKGKGLVVLTGCGHLTGPLFEPIVQLTIEALKEFNPSESL